MDDKDIESLWEECKDIPCHLNKNNLLVIDIDWYIFTQGTCVDDIKRWFIDNYSQDINNLITGQYKNGVLL